jgi:hypothetical protein
MATPSSNDEFIALTMACRRQSSMEPQNWKNPKRDPLNHPMRSEKSFIGQMRETFFTPFVQRALLEGPEMKTARFQPRLRTEPDAILQSTDHWALGLHSCRALSSQRKPILQNNNPKFNVNSRRLFHLRQRMVSFSNPRRLFSLRQQAILTTRACRVRNGRPKKRRVSPCNVSH